MRIFTIIIFSVLLFSPLSSRFAVGEDASEFDLVNLRNIPAFSTFARAYEKIRLEDAWLAIQRAGGIDFAPQNPLVVGVLDAGVDATHPEFGNIQLGSISRPLLRDITFPVKLGKDIRGHGTATVGIIGANNISDTVDGDYIAPHMNGILSGALAEEDYILEVRPSFVPHGLFKAQQVRAFITNVIEKEAGIVYSSYTDTNCSLVPDDEFCLEGSKLFPEETRKWREFFLGLPNILFVLPAYNDNNVIGLRTPTNVNLVGPPLANVVVVGATDLTDNRASFSNFGPGIDIAAPGVDVYAPALFQEPFGVDDYRQPDHPDGFFGGTSASGPFVTGVAGLVLAAAEEKNITLTAADLKRILIESADTLFEDDPVEREKKLGPVDPAVDPIHCNPLNLSNARGCRLNALKAVCHGEALNCTPLLYTIDHPDPQPGAEFGLNVTSVGDVNGNGAPDIAVGVPLQDVHGATNQGRVFVFDGRTSELLLTLDSPRAQGHALFGGQNGVAGLGDVNDDGRPDIAVSAPRHDVGNNADQGRVYVFSP